MQNIRFISVILCMLIGLSAYKPWNWEEAYLTAECAATYAAASYAIRHYNYRPEKGVTKKEAADHFQKLSNILRYFSINSGYEDKMKEKLDYEFAQRLELMRKKKRISILSDDIVACDAHLDLLYTVYSE